MSPKLRFAILQRDGFTCRYCGAKAPDVQLHIDHVMPRAKGGKDNPRNLVTACRDCNLGKSALTLPPLWWCAEEYAMAGMATMRAIERFGSAVESTGLYELVQHGERRNLLAIVNESCSWSALVATLHALVAAEDAAFEAQFNTAGETDGQD